MHRIEQILEWNGWERTEGKVTGATFYHNWKEDEHWMIDGEESVTPQNEVWELWQAAAKCLEIAKTDAANLLKPWMPIAMSLQALNVDKLHLAILNFINEYNRLKEGQGAKEDSQGTASGNEDGAEEGDSEGQSAQEE